MTDSGKLTVLWYCNQNIMPELPEVETFRKYLEGTSMHQRIVDVEAESPELIKPGIDTLREELNGQAFQATHRIGKYLFVENSSPYVLIIHFGMTGWLHYFKDAQDMPQYSRVLFRLDSDFTLAFVCRRKLGWIDRTPNVTDFQQKTKLGLDALDITFEQFEAKLTGRKSPIKPRLLDQKIMAGVGNWIADEILYQSKIHPETSISKLSRKEIRSLYDNMREILQISVEKEAVWQNFPEHFLTHQRDKMGGLCFYTGKPLRKFTSGGRPTYISPERQKIR